MQKEMEGEEGKAVYDMSLGVLQMTNPDDYIRVMGDFVMQNYYQTKSSQCLSDGVLEIKGNFTQIACRYTPSFYACGNHKVILSGTKGQRVTMEESNSCFNVLELKNTSKKGISFSTQISFLGGLITNNVPTQFSKKGVMGWTLRSNHVIDGDLYLVGGTLDLNGYELEINGNLIHSNGTLAINGGKLIVNGDYRMQKEMEGEEGKAVYDMSLGVLQMTNPDDYIRVMGDFVMQNYYQTKSSQCLSDGVLEIKGNFTQIACRYTPSFYACGNHKVILSGEKQQIITMEEANSRFNELILTRPIENGNYIFLPWSRTFWNSIKVDLDYNQSSDSTKS